jgi:hypothetical protein
MKKPPTRTLALLTPVFILLAHYLVVFPHEFAHSFMAWVLGRKADPFAITWGGGSLRNILLLTNIDENVDYRSALARGPAYYVALIALAGPGIANGTLYFLSLAWLKRAWLQARPVLFYFVFWCNFMTVANFYDYIPIRTFGPRDDVANFVHGLGISPWYVFGVGIYLVGFAIVCFLGRGLARAYECLGLQTTASRSTLMVVCVVILFCYYSLPGFGMGDDISCFISMTSWIMVPGILFICWPSRTWVRQQVRLQESLPRVGSGNSGPGRG